jgi:carbohydrate diacid regulator
MIVDEIKKAIHRDLNIMDDKGIIIASTDHNRIGQLHGGARTLLQSEKTELIITADCEAEGTRRGINLPITIQGNCVGVIGITGDPDDVSDLGSAIQTMTEIMIIGIQRQKDLNLREIERLNFIESWILSEIADMDVMDLDSFKLRARMLEIDLFQPRILCAFEPRPHFEANKTNYEQTQNANLVKFIKPLVSENAQNICVSINSRIVVFFAEKSVSAVSHLAHRICNDIKSAYMVDLCCGVSQPAMDYKRVGECYKEALDACRASSRFGAKRVLIYESGTLFYLIQSIPREQVECLQQKVFQNCTDKEKREMLETLNLFFVNNGNISQASSAAFVHTNTFLYRLNKLHRKTGFDPHKPRDIGTLYFLWIYNQL